MPLHRSGESLAAIPIKSQLCECHVQNTLGARVPTVPTFSLRGVHGDATSNGRANRRIAPIDHRLVATHEMGRACKSAPSAAITANMAKLYFNYSTMNAGKSTVLLQASHNYIERGMQTYLLTAKFDDRAGDATIASRIGIGQPADTFAADEDLFAKVAARLDAGPCACVFVDEAQFLEPEQVWQLARAVDDLGVPIMCFGLRVDFQGNLFPGSAALLALSDEMREVRTICHCGKKATMVIRQGEDGKALADGQQVQVGGNETYVSLCRRHWREALGDPR